MRVRNISSNDCFCSYLIFCLFAYLHLVFMLYCQFNTLLKYKEIRIFCNLKGSTCVRTLKIKQLTHNIVISYCENYTCLK